MKNYEQFTDVLVQLEDVDASLKTSLDNVFAFPAENEPAWRKAIADAQNVYEAAKRFEIATASAAANIKFEEQPEWDAAMLRAVAGSEAAKKKIAESDTEWRLYERTKLDYDTVKRNAERWHSIAFQRLTTLRDVYNRLW